MSANVNLINSGKSVWHEFRVLNKCTFSTILIGRDFMTQIGEVTFDMSTNIIKVNNRILKSVEMKSHEVARLIGKIEIPARSECLISGKCVKKLGLMDLEFGPQKIKGVNWVYFSKAKVRPNLEGEFTISVLNVNSGDVKLANRSVIGHVVPHNEILQVVTRKVVF